MAIKFSQFVLKTLPSELDYIVGYTGTENLQITPDNFLAPYLGAYLPLAGGTMTGTTNHGDNVYSQWGTGTDFWMVHNGSNTLFQNETGDLQIHNNANDKNIIFKCDDGAGGMETYFYLDGSGGGSAPFTVWPDGATIALGNGHDLRISHSGTQSKIENYGGTSGFEITQHVEDGDLDLRCDNGSGGSMTYLRLDGSTAAIVAFTPLQFGDNISAYWGASDDLQIYHDGSNSYITDQGTGRLIIKTDYFEIDNAAGTEAIIEGIENGAVNLYYDSAKKLESTATGIQVTDEVSIGTSLVHTGDTDTKVSFGTNNITLIAGGATHLVASSDQTTSIYSGNTTTLFCDTIQRVGIGTTSPGEKLEVDGIIKTVHTDNTYTKLKGTGLYFNRSNSYLIAENDNSLTLNIGADGARWAHTRINSATVKFENGATEYIRITSSGDVGIGTGSPGEKLHVSTDSNTVAKFESTDGNANIRVSDIADNAHLGTVNGATFIGPDTSTGGNNITILANGKVGIGQSNPSYNLEVDGTATVATDPSYIVATAGTFEMAIGSQNSPGVAQEAFVGTLGNTDFKIMANSAFVGRVTTSAKLLIGAGGGVPTAALQVLGIVEYADNAAALVGGLTAGAFYRTGDLLKVVH